MNGFVRKNFRAHSQLRLSGTFCLNFLSKAKSKPNFPKPTVKNLLSKSYCKPYCLKPTV